MRWHSAVGLVGRNIWSLRKESISIDPQGESRVTVSPGCEDGDNFQKEYGALFFHYRVHKLNEDDKSEY